MTWIKSMHPYPQEFGLTTRLLRLGYGLIQTSP
jgi:hypothetical protein